MRRDQLPMHIKPTYVLPQYKTVYVAVSKAACTSFKWLMADVAGEDPQRFHAIPSRMVTRDMCIHLRGRWRKTPTLDSLSDSQLERISPENGWFIFTVTRHPSARLFSAWQSKMLLREPRWVEKHGEDPWFPRVPRTTDDVVEDFDHFARAIARHPHGRVMRDRHFMPQWVEAAPDRMPYSRIYDTAEIGELMGDLDRHLRANGYSGELSLKSSNETPLRPIERAFTPGVREALQELYEADYRELGYDELIPPKLHPGDEYPKTAFDEIARLVERHDRIGDLARLAERPAPAPRAKRPAAPKAPPTLRQRAGRLRRRLLTRVPR
jgi:hypothetical protein